MIHAAPTIPEVVKTKTMSKSTVINSHIPKMMMVIVSWNEVGVKKGEKRGGTSGACAKGVW